MRTRIAVGLMAATIGPAAVSAHRIALLVCTTTFMAALGLVSSYMKPRHRRAARQALGLPAKDEE